MRKEVSQLIKKCYSEKEESTYLEYNLTQEDYGVIVESAK